MQLFDVNQFYIVISLIIFLLVLICQPKMQMHLRQSLRGVMNSSIDDTASGAFNIHSVLFTALLVLIGLAIVAIIRNG